MGEFSCAAFLLVKVDLISGHDSKDTDSVMMPIRHSFCVLIANLEVCYLTWWTKTKKKIQNSVPDLYHLKLFSCIFLFLYLLMIEHVIQFTGEDTHIRLYINIIYRMPTKFVISCSKNIDWINLCQMPEGTKPQFRIYPESTTLSWCNRCYSLHMIF